ncbi:MAG: hypothetical protein JWM36_4637 [Hyphomicrobiales bacterium]|nr:hypothetical protein [Hyphomicrobiales bacterium]
MRLMPCLLFGPGSRATRHAGYDRGQKLDMNEMARAANRA